MIHSQALEWPLATCKVSFFTSEKGIFGWKTILPTMKMILICLPFAVCFKKIGQNPIYGIGLSAQSPLTLSIFQILSEFIAIFVSYTEIQFEFNRKTPNVCTDDCFAKSSNCVDRVLGSEHIHRIRVHTLVSNIC